MLETSPAATVVVPKAAASAAVFRGGKVLLIRRGKGALEGLWSLPGGHIEPGERAREAAAREVREETGVEAQIRAFLDLHEVIISGPDGQLRAHYLIAVHAGVWQSGEAVAGGDAAEARFFPLEALADLQLTAGAEGFVRQARAAIGAEAVS